MVSAPPLMLVREGDSEIDLACVLAESTALESYFQCGLTQEGAGLEEGSDNSDSDEDPEGRSLNCDEDDPQEVIVENVQAHSALAWADKFILETQRKGGRQTENSVLKLWKVCHEIYCAHSLFSI